MTPRSAKLAVIIGLRPEPIRLAPVIRALESASDWVRNLVASDRILATQAGNTIIGGRA